MEVFFVRHGQTSYNAKKVIQGTLPIPLNGIGITQACSAAKKLIGENVEAIFYSPTVRTVQTARIISQSFPHSEMLLDKRLTEREFGEIEGDDDTYYIEKLSDFWDENKNIDVSGIETILHLKERLSDFLNHLRDTPFETVVVVTHAAPIAMMLRILGEETDERDIKNCEILERKI